MENQVEALFTLHLRVLQQILVGTEYNEISKMYRNEFDQLNYEEIIINRAHRLTFDATGTLIGAYPVSPKANQFKVTIDGVGEGYAMCAVDALGIAYTFMKKTVIETKDEGTGESLKFQIDPNLDLLENDNLLMSYPSQGYSSLKQLVAENTQLATSTCPNILFYSKQTPPNDEGLALLDFEEALNEAIEIFSQSAMKDHIRASL